MIFTVIDDPGYRMSPSFSKGICGTERNLRRSFSRMSSAVAPVQRARGRGAELVGGTLMRLTLSVIKADIGSVGGHTKPSTRMMAAVEGEVAKNGRFERHGGRACDQGKRADACAVTKSHRFPQSRTSPVPAFLKRKGLGEGD